MSGYIRLFRDIRKHWIWEDEKKLKWWLDIIMLANYKDNKVLIGGTLIPLSRGQFHTSEAKLATRWGVTRRTVTNFLKLLESDEMIVTKRTVLGTTIEVLNYKEYQDISSEICTTDSTVNDTTSDTTSDTVNDSLRKKEKESKRNKNNIFSPPTLEEVKQYCIERNNKIDAQTFIDFYSSKGWMIGRNKMKDWKAAIRTWESKNKSNYAQQNFYQNQQKDYDYEERKKAQEFDKQMRNIEEPQIRGMTDEELNAYAKQLTDGL